MARSGYWFKNYSSCCTRRMCLQRMGKKPKMKKLFRKKGRECPKKYFVARSFVASIAHVKKYWTPTVTVTPITMRRSLFHKEVLIHCSAEKWCSAYGHPKIMPISTKTIDDLLNVWFRPKLLLAFSLNSSLH